MKASQFDGTAVELFQVKTGAYVWVPAHKRLRQHLAETGIDGSDLLVKGQAGPGGLRHGRGLTPPRASATLSAMPAPS
jgi:hypothetical protein